MSASPLQVSLSSDQVEALKEDCFRARPWAARASLALALQMKVLWNERGDYWALWDAIENLEREAVASPGNRRASKKSATPFKTPPLLGFWHQHVHGPRHILRNLEDRWGMAFGGNEALDAMVAGAAAECGGDEMLWPNRLAHGLTVGAYDERAAARRLTGDWLIFAKHRGMNYYLLGVAHPQGRLQDAEIYRQLQARCKAEFPFLFQA